MNDPIKECGFIDYTPVMARIAVAMQKYEESRVLMLSYNADTDHYFDCRNTACCLIDEGAELLEKTMLENYPPVVIQMIRSVHHILKDYEGMVLLPMFSNKEIRDEIEKPATYLVKNPETNLVKIGKSTNISERIKALQCGSGVKLDKIAVIDDNVESLLHKKFSKNKVFNEWFDDKDGLILLYFQNHPKLL